MTGRPPSFAQTVDVETPELVVLTYTIAGVGSRAAAALIDYAICLLAFVAIQVGVWSLGVRGVIGGATRSAAWSAALLYLLLFAILWGYYVLFEGLADGQTPGKRLLRLRAVRDGGYSLTFGASAVRNLVRMLDMQPVFTYAVAIASVLLTKRGKRLGDLAAGTIVVREGLTARPAAPLTRHATETAAVAQARLTNDEYLVLERFAERRADLSAERRSALAEQVAARLAPALTSIEGTSVITRLLTLYEEERRARAGGAVAIRETGAARERSAIVAAGSKAWNAFAALLHAAQGGGLTRLPEHDVRQFVESYRDAANDLARLQTASRGRQDAEVFFLSRLVAAAHNLLYRGTSLTLGTALRALALEGPREVRRSWRPILLAAIVFFGPAAIAHVAVVRDPTVAETFLPPGMLDRAEEGLERARRGTGYIPDPELFRPVMASTIIANNVQVTFAAFALGLTAGIGTLLLLLTNGVAIGGVMGLYTSRGIASLLIKFVAPHGVLELSAICIAGGGGLLLAGALLLPGERTRRRALVENGRRAIHLIGVSTVLLVVAGTLEGFVSPIPSWSLGAKLAVSGVTAVALLLYLSAGRKSGISSRVQTASESAAGFDLEVPIDDRGGHRLR
ncbi:MAG: stage II sporulation protein M [Gemmatimonadaceae bacterium]